MDHIPDPRLIHPPQAPTVPVELVDGLHQANEHFHEAKQKLEHEMDVPEYRYQERVSKATQEVRKAEAALEQAEEKLHQNLEASKRPPDSGNASS
jgi:hypothetical protein